MNRIIIIFIFTITCFLSSCKKESKLDNNPLVGKWKVIDATHLPFEHISFCEKIGIGAEFHFDNRNNLKVFKKNGELCSKDHRYFYEDSIISMVEWDMFFKYDIVKLDSDSLKFRNNYVPRYYLTDSDLSIQHINSIIESIQKNGIIVSLVRIENGG